MIEEREAVGKCKKQGSRILRLDLFLDCEKMRSNWQENVEVCFVFCSENFIQGSPSDNDDFLLSVLYVDNDEFINILFILL